MSRACSRARLTTTRYNRLRRKVREMLLPARRRTSKPLLLVSKQNNKPDRSKSRKENRRVGRLAAAHFFMDLLFELILQQVDTGIFPVHNDLHQRVMPFPATLGCFRVNRSFASWTMYGNSYLRLAAGSVHVDVAAEKHSRLYR